MSQCLMAFTKKRGMILQSSVLPREHYPNSLLVLIPLLVYFQECVLMFSQECFLVSQINDNELLGAQNIMKWRRRSWRRSWRSYSPTVEQKLLFFRSQ